MIPVALFDKLKVAVDDSIANLDAAEHCIEQETPISDLPIDEIEHSLTLAHDNIQAGLSVIEAMRQKQRRRSHD